jgi:hypothetical protein
MRTFIPAVTVFASLFLRVQCANCDFQPVNIPIKVVELPNGGNLRGGAVSAGNPVQNFSLSPAMLVTWFYSVLLRALMFSSEINNTFLWYRSDDCDVTEAACLTRRGGFFLPDDSKTYKNDTAPTPFNKNWETSETQTSGDIGSDSLILNENVTLLQFPLGIAKDKVTVRIANIGQTSLGLGRNSSVLSILKKAGTIGSNSWGYWWGLDGSTDPAKMNGNIVLGGYDRAKIKNPENNYTGKLTEPGLCPGGMTITINEIRLNFPNGSEPNLLQSSPLLTCVCPQCSTGISMRYDPYMARFEQWTESFSVNRSLGINFFNMMYRADEVYQGDLTVVLDSGLSIRIPNSQLAIPDRTIANDGHQTSNMSVRDLMLYSLQDVNKDDVPRLGRVFFSSAYLWVNNNDRTFTIWEANPTEDSDLVSVVDSDLSTTCGTSRVIPPTLTNTTTATATATNAISSDTQTAAKNKALSKGALGGIIAGGTVVLGIIVAVVWYFCLYKRFRRNTGELLSYDLSEAPPQYNTRTPMMEMMGAEPSEMKGDEQQPQELWSGTHVYELSSSN